MKWTKRIVMMHWIFALMLIVGVISIYTAAEFNFKTYEWRVAMGIHVIAGVLLTILLPLRIYWRLKDKKDSPNQEILPKIIQSTMLGLLLFLGVTGLVVGIYYEFFFVVFGDALLQKNYISFIHHEMGSYLLVFIGLHIMGAFKFIIIKSDNLLKRMMF